MKVLHITTWYPHAEKPLEAIWIKRIVNASGVAGQVYHIAVNPGAEPGFVRRKSKNVTHRIINFPIKSWWLAEVVNFFALAYYLWIKRIHRGHDAINFHIAYPQLVYWHILRIFVSKPVVVSEHWSAYHFNFGVAKPLPRIKRIFRNRLPVITVSRSLANDIQAFSGVEDLNTFVVPNLVDTTIFSKSREVSPDTSRYFMVSQWKWPKQPLIILKAFSSFVSRQQGSCQLRIAGYGPQLDEMRAFVESAGLKQYVVFLPTLSEKEVAMEMNACTAFLHCSDYETFSVVCAEALCCGTPVVASKVGGIPEFLGPESGILVDRNTEEEWLAALRQIEKLHFDRDEISRRAGDRFSVEKVRVEYIDVLNTVHGTQR